MKKEKRERIQAIKTEEIKKRLRKKGSKNRKDKRRKNQISNTIH